MCHAFEAAVTRTHTLLLLHRGSPAPPWVAGSPVAFLVTTLRWPPVRCAAGLVFLWGAAHREGRHLVSSGGLFSRRHMLDTSLSSTWPSAGLCRWPALGSSDVVCHCGCAEDRGSLSRISPPVPGPHAGRGQTCRTPLRGMLRQQPVRRNPQASLVCTCRTRSAQGTWGALTHARKQRCSWTPWGMLMHQQRASWWNPADALQAPTSQLGIGTELHAKRRK